VKRDSDRLRFLLLYYESEPDFVIPSTSNPLFDEEEKDQYHLLLLEDQGFVTRFGENSFRLTNSGHDFLEAIRDEGIWQRTKNVVAETGGSATLDILKQLAVGFLKKKIRDHTDIDF
jgi:hypothetical protein